MLLGAKVLLWLRLLWALGLLGATFVSMAKATPRAPIPPGFLRRNFSLCECSTIRTTAVLAEAPRLKMIREESEGESGPREAVSAPRSPATRVRALSFGPATTPCPSPPHLRC